jgi:hypothetical protein
VIEKLFECVLFADQTLAQAAWVEPATLHDLAAVVEILKRGPISRAPLPLAPYELQWRAEPGSAITTVRREGHVVLLSVVLEHEGAELLDVWLEALRGSKSIQLLHGDDKQAFEVLRRLPQRPMSASVMMPEGTREEAKALLDLHRTIAFALLSAKWT